jgi:hypothetical protein
MIKDDLKHHFADFIAYFKDTIDTKVHSPQA